MRSWLVALRIARREARRHRGRSILVIALIGLPVLALSFAAVSYDTFRLTPAERADRQMGTGNALVRWDYDAPVRQDPVNAAWSVPLGADAGPKRATTDEITAALPAGTRILPGADSVLVVRTAGGVGSIQARELDYADPMARGILTPLRGRAPATADEVALSPYASTRVGTGIGGTLSSADGTRSWRVVGLVEDPNELRRPVAVFRPGALPPSDQYNRSWIAVTPGTLTWAEVRRLNTVGIAVLSRGVLLDPPPDRENPMAVDAPRDTFAAATLLGGILVLEVVLLAGPAFAVGARRRRRELGLVCAAGGTPAHLRRIVLADGVVLGCAAAVAGVALGILAAVAGSPLIEEYVAQSRPGALRVYPSALAALAVVAVTAGVLAALVPAWSAARQPVVAALSGRYAASRLRRWWVVAGLAGLAVGAAVTVYGGRTGVDTTTLAGLVIGELGLVLCTPALVGLVARLGGRLPLAPRIALRDIGRNRAAAAPAISAVLAAVAVSALLGTIIASQRATGAEGSTALPLGYAAAVPNGDPQGAAAALPAVEQALRASLPVRDAVTVALAACAGDGGRGCWLEPVRPVERRCPYLVTDRELTAAEQKAARRDRRCDHAGLSVGSTGQVHLWSAVVRPDDLPRFLDLPPDVLVAATATLRAGGILVDDPDLIVDGRVTVEVFTPQTDVGAAPGDRPVGRPVVVPGYAIPVDVAAPERIYSPGALATAGLTSRPYAVVASTTRMPTQVEQDRLNAALTAAAPDWIAAVERPFTPENDLELLILAIASGLLTLGAAGIATGLAAADGRADLATLAAVGASPGVRRLLTLSQTGLIAGMGSVLGVAAGVGAAAAFITGNNRAKLDAWPGVSLTPLHVPWTNVAIALAVVPLVAMLGAGLLTRARLPIERRR